MPKFVREIVGKMIRNYVNEFLTDEKTRKEVYDFLGDLKSLALVKVKKSVISSIKER